MKSKNLFNFRPQGFIDPEVVLHDEKMKKEMGLDPVAMEEQMLSQTETEFAGGMRYYPLYTNYYILLYIAIKIQLFLTSLSMQTNVYFPERKTNAKQSVS